MSAGGLEELGAGVAVSTATLLCPQPRPFLLGLSSSAFEASFDHVILEYNEHVKDYYLSFNLTLSDSPFWAVLILALPLQLAER